MRINARLDEESQRQIEYLTAATGTGVSHVVRESLSHYYHQVRSQQAGLKSFSAWVGKGQSGRRDVASNVKKFVSQALADKAEAKPLPKRRPSAATKEKPSAAKALPSRPRRK